MQYILLIFLPIIMIATLWKFIDLEKRLRASDNGEWHYPTSRADALAILGFTLLLYGGLLVAAIGFVVNLVSAHPTGEASFLIGWCVGMLGQVGQGFAAHRRAKKAPANAMVLAVRFGFPMSKRELTGSAFIGSQLMAVQARAATMIGVPPWIVHSLRAILALPFFTLLIYGFVTFLLQSN